MEHLMMKNVVVVVVVVITQIHWSITLHSLYL